MPVSSLTWQTWQPWMPLRRCSACPAWAAWTWHAACTRRLCCPATRVPQVRRSPGLEWLDIVVRDPTKTTDIEELARRLADAGLGIMWVTHDHAQVARLADHVVVLHRGRRATAAVAEEYLSEWSAGAAGPPDPDANRFGSEDGRREDHP